MDFNIPYTHCSITKDIEKSPIAAILDTFKNPFTRRNLHIKVVQSIIYNMLSHCWINNFADFNLISIGLY